MSLITSRIETYYATVFDGTGKSLPEVKPFIEDYVHPDLVIHTPDGDLNYEQALERIHVLLQDRAKIKVQYVKPDGENRVEYRIKVILSSEEEPIHVTNFATFRNGKYISVDAYASEKAFYKIHGINSNIIKKIKSYYTKVYDGTGKSLGEVEPIIESMLDPDVIVHTPNGDQNYVEHLVRVGTRLKYKTKAQVRYVKVVAKNIVQCQAMFLCTEREQPTVQTYTARVRNGRFVELFTGVTPDMTTKAEIYFSTVYDGTGKSLEEVMPHIEAFIDPNLVVHTADGTLTYNQFLECVRILLKAHAQIEVEQVREFGENRVQYQLKVILAEQEHPRILNNIASVKNGRFVSIEPSSNNKNYNLIFGVSPDIAHKIQKYFGILYDGSGKSIEEVRPAIDELMDPNVIFELPSGEIGYDQLLAHIDQLLQQGFTANVLYVKTNKDLVEFQFESQLPNQEPETFTSHAVIKNGKFVRVNHGLTSSQYRNFFRGSFDTVHTVTDYFNTVYDGKEKTVEDVRPLIESMCDPNIVFVTPLGEIHYDQFIKHVDMLLRERTTVEVLKVKNHPKGIEYSLKFMRPGKEPLIVESLGTLKNGRLVRVEPQENGHVYNAVFGQPELEVPAAQ